MSIEELVSDPTHRLDGEVLGLDTDGSIVQWDGDHQQAYNCGETPQEFGIRNLTAVERERVGVQ